MDLATLDTTTTAEDGAVLELLHPKTGEVLRQEPPADAPPGSQGPPITITLAGQDSARYRRARNAQVTRRLSRRNPGKVTGEDAEAEGLDVIVACVVAWDGVVFGGEPLACTPGNVRRLFGAVPAFREQADTFIHDRANYLRD